MQGVRFQESKDLIDSWSSIKRGALAPVKRDFDPISVKNILSRIFIISFYKGQWNFRLAGTDFYGIYGSELTHQDFFEIWNAEYYKIRAGIAESSKNMLPFLVDSSTFNGEKSVTTETVMVPFRSDPEYTDIDMFIGVQSFEKAWWVGGIPVTDMRIESVKLIGERERRFDKERVSREIPSIFPYEMPSNKVKFQVIEGGRQD